MVYTVFLCFLTLNAVQLMQDNKKRHQGISSFEVADAFVRPSLVSVCNVSACLYFLR